MLFNYRICHISIEQISRMYNHMLIYGAKTAHLLPNNLSHYISARISRKKRENNKYIISFCDQKFPFRPLCSFLSNARRRRKLPRTFWSELRNVGHGSSWKDLDFLMLTWIHFWSIVVHKCQFLMGWRESQRGGWNSLPLLACHGTCRRSFAQGKTRLDGFKEQQTQSS